MRDNATPYGCRRPRGLTRPCGTARVIVAEGVRRQRLNYWAPPTSAIARRWARMVAITGTEHAARIHYRNVAAGGAGGEGTPQQRW